jgi:hypothetical protein
MKPDEIRNIIAAGTVGTTAMTLFSYLISEKEGKNFKEPELLGKMVDRLSPAMEKQESAATGWAMHYAVGILFAALYYVILKKAGSNPAISRGLLFGGITGLPAILVWDVVFKVHPNPPRIPYAKYYKHLFVAHLIFGAFTFLQYKKPSTQ